jgi:hypothetical protein
LTPPIYPVLAANPDVTALLGTDTRFYPDEAPQGVLKPYAVYQIISGNPENYLGDAADIDKVSLQIDVYALDRDESEDIAKVIRAAIEGLCYITAFRSAGKEPETLLYRNILEVDWFEDR